MLMQPEEIERIAEAVAARVFQHIATKRHKSHFTVKEIAAEWSVSRDTVTRAFRDEPGVMKMSNAGKRNTRIKTTLRIPLEVKERVERKRAN